MKFNWFRKTTRPMEDLPPFWLDYLSFFDEKYAPSTPIEKIRFVILDTETTGLDPRNDQILSIGAVTIQNWEIRVEDRFECMIHQEYEPVSRSIEVHGILPKNRDYSLSEKEALLSFLGFIRQSVLVGHHLGFDVSMINTALSEIVGRRVQLENPQVDTLNLARRLLPPHQPLPAEALSLDQLVVKYKVLDHDRHTASGDAFMTGILFLKMLSRLQKRGNKTLSDLLRK